ncbi:MAG: hypothetical protein COV37_19965 [Bdellovibrio sp. CG11_big_fil_rev_8_21_14_0_20_39_38]|nr:MAG: hypothetical protein COW78_09695 [Bdellovibrio sp. CG22_combo_CG10-13_8_21_14_all_39_27]PIR32382.1 MAG: hypothetical protein COV37_19965 [Bdellovibrio sp. CG11_big_fil_rev_8_21_14_0_20_39_38]
MFSSTAYEAFYTIIGLHFHEASIQIITSQAVLAGILALTFGAAFFFAVWGYFKKYLPGSLGGGRGANLATFVKLIASFLLGVSLLKVGSFGEVKDYKRVSWHHNDYIETKIPNLQETYKVSFVFDLMTQSAEELAKFFSMVVDKLFERTNSELHAPSSFYKAIMYAGSVSIEEPALRSLIDLYSVQCFDKVIPQIENAKKMDKISEFFRPSHGTVDQALKGIVITTSKGTKVTCYDLKEKVGLELHNHSRKIQGKLALYESNISLKINRNLLNEMTSSSLNNYFNEKAETYWFNIQKGAEIPSGGFAKFLLGWKRFWSWDGFLSFLGNEHLEGASLTADRALQFNEYLKRAPHLKGMVKLFLIAMFPWLIFFIFAGKWHIIIAWWAVYASVLLWTPLWALLYHLMSSIALSTDVMASFGRLNDGVSLYSSQLITNKIYQFYAIYSWLQIIVGPLPTVFLAWGMFTGVLRDSEQESSPEGISTVASVAGATVTGGASAGVTAGASAGIKTAASKTGYRPKGLPSKDS